VSKYSPNKKFKNYPRGVKTSSQCADARQIEIIARWLIGCLKTNHGRFLCFGMEHSWWQARSETWRRMRWQTTLEHLTQRRKTTQAACLSKAF